MSGDQTESTTEHVTNTLTTERAVTPEMIAKKLGKKTTSAPIIDTTEMLLADAIITYEQLATRLDGSQADRFVRQVGKEYESLKRRYDDTSKYTEEYVEEHTKGRARKFAENIVEEQDKPVSEVIRLANRMKDEFDFPITPELIKGVTVDAMKNAEALQYAVKTFYKNQIADAIPRLDEKRAERVEFAEKSAREYGRKWAAMLGSGKISAAELRKLARKTRY